jgi:hypothetical protein
MNGRIAVISMMFIPTPILMLDLAPNMVQEAPVARQRVPVDEELTVEADHWYKDLANGKTVFEGHVRATYGLTALSTERLVVDDALGVMVAEGESRVDDPEATVAAKQIVVNWKTKESSADDVRIEAGYVLVTGDRLEVKNEPEATWIIENATVELTDLSAGGNRFLAREVVIYPGRKAVAKHVIYQIIGQKLGPIPSQTFNLDRRVTGLKLPSLKYRGGAGFGLSWQSSLLLDEQTIASGSWDAFPGQRSGFRLEMTRSFIGEGQQLTKVSPRSDLDERFIDGWFNSVTLRDPELEIARIRDKKSSLTIGTYWNTSTDARPIDATDVSKAFDLTYEMGGPLGSGGWITTARLQQARESSVSPWVNRVVADTTFLAPQFDFGVFKSHARLDLIGTSSSRGSFGIVRTELGVTREVTPGLLLGGAYVWASQDGSPDFGYDPLSFGSGIHLRMDYERGPYTVRYLMKYDFSGKQWYDHEWEFALAAGSLEPYISRREFPGDFRFGVRLRVDQLTDRLLDRDLKRNRPVR